MIGTQGEETYGRERGLMRRESAGEAPASNQGAGGGSGEQQFLGECEHKAEG